MERELWIMNRDYRENTLNNCTFVKTILMLLVVLGHSTIFWTSNWFVQSPIIPSKSLCYFSKWINSFHIYGFTLVSGYIFAFKMTIGGYNKYLVFVINKIKRLIIPYVFVAIIWVIPITEYFFQWDRSEIFKRYILCTGPSQLWFLWMLFWVFILAWPLWKILKNPIKGGIASLVMYFIGVMGGAYF